MLVAVQVVNLSVNCVLIQSESNLKLSWSYGLTPSFAGSGSRMPEVADGADAPAETSSAGVSVGAVVGALGGALSDIATMAVLQNQCQIALVVVKGLKRNPGDQNRYVELGWWCCTIEGTPRTQQGSSGMREFSHDTPRVDL